MNIFGFSYLMVIFTSLTMGTYAYQKNPQDKLNKIFLVFTLFAVYWMFTFFAFTQAIDYNEAKFWRRMFCLWPLLVPIQLHFVLTFIDRSDILENRLILYLLYGSSFLVILLEFNDLVSFDLVQKEWGWVETNVFAPGFILASIWSLILSFLSLGLVAYNYKSNYNIVKKQQAKYILVGLSLPNILGIISQIVFPLISVRFPDMSIPAFGLSTIVIAYGISRYSLFSLTETSAIESILSSMTTKDFSVLFEHSFDLVYAIDKNLNLIYVSSSIEEILGYTKKESLGHHISKFLDKNSFKLAEDEVNRAFSRPLEEMETLSIELQFITKSGSKIALLTNSIQIVKDGEVYGVQGIAKNITELVRAKEEQEKLKTKRENFIATTGHSLRTPLTILNGYVEFLRENYQSLDKNKIDQSLDKMANNVHRLIRLVNVVIEADKIQRDAQSFIFEEINIAVFLSETIDSFKVILGDHIQLFLSEGLKNRMIKADYDKLQQVIYNIIENSIKNTDDTNRHILVTTNKDGDNLDIIISDNGAGIEKHNLEKIFDQFFSSPTKFSTTGSGIGLFVSKKIIKAHNGNIRAESKGTGLGTNIIISLPLLPSKWTGRLKNF